MRGLERVLAAGLLALATALPAVAQDDPAPATLIADEVSFDNAPRIITATGEVEIFYQGTRLRAASVVYDGLADWLTIEGPIILTEANGRTVILADFAELSPDLREGVLRSARLVLDRQLQIAATEIDRSGGRYTQLYQSIASSCRICEGNPTPLWEIRARRIVHDREERQLYFEEAQFRALGVPLMYLPRMRLPDPTLERATGFLVPGLFGNDEIGTGLRVPYFFMLGDHRDLTVAPYYTTAGNYGAELRYRQAFGNGWIQADAALSFDDLTDDDMRGYIFADGFFVLDRDFVLDIGIEGVTDRAYLVTYGISEIDRLESNISLSRTRRDEYIGIGVTRFSSLRDGDDNRTLPNNVAEGEITRRFVPPVLGGIASLGLAAHTHLRTDDTDIIGRDVSRVTASADWRRSWVLPAGVLLAVETELYADFYSVTQDSTFPANETRIAPYAAVELRWPWAMTSQTGVTHLIEPTVQLAWSDNDSATVPNEDSVVVEFDEANLFSLNRFPGEDARETGQRMAVGLSYTRTDPLGWSVGVTAGRVWRDMDYMQFTSGSGLDGTRSDWLVATHLGLGDRLSLINRALFDESFEVTSNELALAWRGERHDLQTALTWLLADPAEGRPVDMAEWRGDLRYDFANAWSAEAGWRYDFEANEPTRAGLALTYATECVDVEFSLSRRFTSSATLNPATEFGLAVSLNGFGASRSGRGYSRGCQ